MRHFSEVKSTGKGALAALLSADFKWEPLDLEEMTFNIIGPHCLQRAIVSQVLLHQSNLILKRTLGPSSRVFFHYKFKLKYRRLRERRLIW